MRRLSEIWLMTTPKRPASLSCKLFYEGVGVVNRHVCISGEHLRLGTGNMSCKILFPMTRARFSALNPTVACESTRNDWYKFSARSLLQCSGSQGSTFGEIDLSRSAWLMHWFLQGRANPAASTAILTRFCTSLHSTGSSLPMRFPKNRLPTNRKLHSIKTSKIAGFQRNS